jgi:hypothetical protein
MKAAGNTMDAERRTEWFFKPCDALQFVARVIGRVTPRGH